ncbi:hypothetical protein RH915_02795 [Serpentinicella sp. ANB-PHB4]|uniref:hypothetical protein n=1 Tax=Serpentinicella sp. ANB-PHB4 TaxID=3074076 RepID=UPI00285639A7|nr:hypothetical protein [Serpentinicella sp. ANB-PHB4]MDR5658409.1 hypothetical protein [Serpentinicella sp. ANB-PHB4]
MSYILSAGTVTLPEIFDQQQQRLDLGVTEVEDVIVLGQITECETGEPIVGAIVKYFFTNPFTGELEDVCHTFSGCDGYYMIRIPPTVEVFNPETEEFEDFNLANQTITIMAVGSDCPDTLEPCECPE